MIEFILLIVCLLFSTAIGVRLLVECKQNSYTVPVAVHTSSLPSVSVCIAARNERHALEQMLEHLLASDYQKMEILVLDDSSEDDTSLIIKSFAHAGVRFVPGRPLPEGWLGRNHAYQTLAHEASGDYILYLDVDTLVAPHSISRLIDYTLTNHLRMVSVLPRREDSMRISSIFGSLRHMWELILSTSLFPSSSGAVWLIKRTHMLDLERPLSNYGLSVRPEAHIAKQLSVNNGYKYIIGNRQLGMRYEKRWHSQEEAAERLYFPLFGRSHKGIVLALIIYGLLIIPIVFFITALIRMNTTLIVSWAICAMLNICWFAVYSASTNSSPGWFIRSALWPLIVIQDLSFYVISVFRYTTKSVSWKGRSILAQPSNRSHYEINE